MVLSLRTLAPRVSRGGSGGGGGGGSVEEEEESDCGAEVVMVGIKGVILPLRVVVASSLDREGDGGEVSR